MQLEQLSDDDPGWMDQVGGLLPGMNGGRVNPGLPLQVHCAKVEANKAWLATLSRHLLLVWTGQAHLNRDLQQIVVRRWNARIPEMVDCCTGLVKNVETGINAVQEQNVAKLGQVLDTYWAQKKAMAKGCEPAACARFIAHLRSNGLIHGASLCGGGGGGFMLLITVQPDSKVVIESAMRQIGEGGLAFGENMTAHTVSVDTEGVEAVCDT